MNLDNVTVITANVMCFYFDMYLYIMHYCILQSVATLLQLVEILVRILLLLLSTRS